MNPRQNRINRVFSSFGKLFNNGTNIAQKEQVLKYLKPVRIKFNIDQARQVMAANLLTIEAQLNSRVNIEKDEAFGKKIGLIASLFGCSHSRLTRPFSQNNVGYRSCLQCGARKKFDLETRTTSGSFYYPPPVNY